MPAPAVPTALNIANWFLKHAETNGWLLEAEKLQHLLFISQMHYALLNGLKPLMPAAFVCNKDGFIEPNVAQALSVGLPAPSASQLSPSITSFLELVWQKYAPMSIKDLTTFIKTSPAYKENYTSGQKNLIDYAQTALLFKQGLKKSSGNSPKMPNNRLSETANKTERKILISQNGPVVVSQWQPRKLSHKENKETLNA